MSQRAYELIQREWIRTGFIKMNTEISPNSDLPPAYLEYAEQLFTNNSMYEFQDMALAVFVSIAEFGLWYLHMPVPLKYQVN